MRRPRRSTGGWEGGGSLAFLDLEPRHICKLGAQQFGHPWLVAVEYLSPGHCRGFLERVTGVLLLICGGQLY